MVERESGGQVDAPLGHLFGTTEGADADGAWSVGLTCLAWKARPGRSSGASCWDPATWILIFSPEGRF